MIYTNVTVKILNNGTATANTRVLLYRGDREVEIQFSLVGNPFVVERSAFAQLIITRTKGGPIFTNISAVKDSKVILTITEDNIDEMTEIGFYNFQIRLFDEDMSARVTLPPIENGLEVREPIADDNAATIGYAMVNYSRPARAETPDEPTFDEYEDYNRTFWQDGDYITDVKMNKIEDAIYTINKRSLSNVSAAYISSSMNEEQKVNIGEDFMVTFDFVSPNLGRGTLKVNVNNAPKMSMYVEQEETTVAISHEYLTTGNNKVTLYVVDRAGKMSNELTFTVRYGSASIVSDFDSNTAYLQGSVIRYYFTPSALDTSLALTFYMIVDGVLQGTTTCTADKRGYYTFPTNMTADGHRCQAYIIDGEGNKSNVLEFNLVIINKTSLVVVSNTVDPSVEEGNQLALDFKVYMQGATSFITKVYVDDNLVSTGTCGLDTSYYRTSSLKEGKHTVRLDVYDVTEKVSDSITWNVTVTPSVFTRIMPVTTGSLFIASAVDRSNSDENRNLLIGTDQDGNNISAQLTNFSFDSESGWIDNELIFSGASTLTIPIAPLANNARYGFTLDIEFTSKAIGVDDALVLKLWDDTKNCGIKITTENLILRSAEGNECNLYFEDNANTSVMFIIDRNEGKAKIYLNGVMCSAFQLSDYTANGETFLEDFSTNSNVILGGSGYCKLRNIRVYQVALTTDEILNNFIANKNSTGEQKALVEFQKGNTLPTMTIYCDFSGLGKDDKKPCKIVYVSTDEEKYGKSFTLDHKQSTLQYQGTSSMAYPIKNYRINLADESGNKWRYDFPKGKPEWRYTLKADFMSSGHWQNTGLTKWINDNLYNYNESDEKSMNPKKWFDIHNGGSLQDTRECIYGFPCRLILINDGTTALNEGQNEPSPGNTKDMGIFNFNHDKDDTDTMGFDSDNFPNCMSFEIAANSDTSSGAFISYTPNDEQTELEYLQESFEMRYPDPDDYDPWHGYLGLKSDRILVDYNKTDEGYRTVGFDFITSKSSAKVSSDVPIVSLECMDGEESLMKVAVGAVEGTPMVIGGTNRVRFIFEEKPNEITIDGAHYYIGELTDVEYKNPYQEEGIMTDYGLKRVVDWVDKCSDEEFVRDFDLYFNRDYTLRYYLLVIALGMIDNLGKNMMFDTWDCKIWMPRFYDCDTICSYSNDGTIKFDVDIEMEQGYWNTSSSRLWTRIRDLMHNELVAKYADMRANGLTYESLMQCFYDEQIAKIPQAYYNMDADVKYLPFGDEYLGKAHGDGYEHLKRWLKNRLIFTDTLFDYSPSYENDILTIRANTTELMNLQIETYTPVYQHLSWFNGQMDKVKINRGEKVNFSGRAAAATDQEILIYGGSNVKKISGITSTNPSAMLLGGATRLTELIAPDCPILVDINANKANLAPHTYLNKVDLSGCTQLGGNLRLNNSPLIRDIDMTDTVITGINFPPSAKNLETLKIPETVTELSIRSAMILRNLELPSNIEYLSLIDTPQLQTITVTTCDDLKTLIMEKPASNPFVMIGKAPNLEYVRLIDIKAQTTTEAVQKLLNVKGLDAAGNVVDAGQAVSGTITLTTCSTSLEAELKAAYPNVTFIVQKYTQSFTVKFVDGDGNTLYETEALSNGEVVYVGPTPTKTTDAQYTYEWIGWDTPLKPIIGNMTIKATFKSILRYYDIYFYDGNTMEVISHQYLGYGSSPTLPSFPSGLNMWSPSVGKVTGPAQYIAKYAPYPESLSIFSFKTITDETIDDTSSNAYTAGMNTSATMPAAVIFPFKYNNKPVTQLVQSGASSSDRRANVTNVYIPETIHSIGNYVFHQCTNLTELNIPSSIRKIVGTQTFSGSGITKIIAPGCQTFGSDSSYDYGVCYNMPSLEYVILGSKEYPFKELQCKSNTVGYRLFYSCPRLKFVNLITENGLRSDVIFAPSEANNTDVNYIFSKEPVSIESINGVNYLLINDEWAVVGLSDTTLTEITIPDMIEGRPVTTIMTRAFFYNTTLTAVKGCGNIREIQGHAFYANNSDTILTQVGNVEGEVNLPNLEEVGQYAFYYRKGITRIDAPNLKNVGDCGFYGLLNLTYLNIPKVETLGRMPFFNAGSRAERPVSMPALKNLITVGTYAFEYSGISSFVAPKLQSIPSGLLSDCESLKYAIIGSVEYPVESMYYYKSAGYPTDSSQPFCDNRSNRAVVLVTDAKSTTELVSSEYDPDAYKYQNFGSIGGEIEGVGDNNNIYLTNVNPEYEEINGIAYINMGGKRILLYNISTDGDIDISDLNVVAIGGYAFDGNRAITGITIGSSLKKIAGYALAGNYNTRNSIKYLKGDFTLERIGRMMCAYSLLTTLGDTEGVVNLRGVKTIPDYAFQTASVTDIIALDVTTIGNGVFSECANLKSIDAPNAETAGQLAFGNTGLEFLALPKVTSISPGLCYQSKKLKYFMAGSEDYPVTYVHTGEVNSTGGAPFGTCGAIKKIILCTKSGTYSGVTFPDTSKYVGSIDGSSSSSFKYTGSDYVQYRTDGTYLGRNDDYVYMYNSDGARLLSTLKDWSTDSVISIPASINEHDVVAMDFVIRENTLVTRIDLPTALESIPDYFGYKCTSLVSVTGTSKIKRIGLYAFYEATSLVDFDFSSVEKIGYYGFARTKLKTLIAPNLRETGTYVFDKCNNIEYAYLPKMTKLVYGVINSIMFGSWINLKMAVIGSKDYPVTQMTYLSGATSSSLPFYYTTNLRRAVIVTDEDNKQNLPVNTGANIGYRSAGFGLDDGYRLVTTSLVDARLYIDDNYAAIIMDETDDAIICEDKVIQDSKSYNIPSKIDGITVTGLATYSYAEKNKLVTLTVPNTVEEIAYMGIFKNTAMTTLRGCKGVRILGALGICSNDGNAKKLCTIGDVDNEINLPSVEAIYRNGLAYCSLTGNVNIPKVVYLDEYAMNYNSITGNVNLGGNIYCTKTYLFYTSYIGGTVTLGSSTTPITDTSSWGTSMFGSFNTFKVTIYIASGTTATGAPWGGTNLTINYINV